MPIELDNTNIIIDNNSTTSILEVIKSKGSYTEKVADSATYSCGDGNNGKLGHGNTSHKYTPTLIQHFVTNNIIISQFSAGISHSIFLATNGKVYSGGWNEGGQLGLGNTSDKNTPNLIQYFVDSNITISYISAGYAHSIFLDTNGKVYSCGYNSYGQLGHGDTTNYSTPTLIQYFTDSNGNDINYTNITISRISGGEYHSIFLDTNGNVYSCGSNYDGGFNSSGQLGHGDTSHKSTPTLIQYFATNSITISQVSAGIHHSIFLATNGYVYSCGNASSGQLGHGDTSLKTTPTLIQNFTDSNGNDINYTNITISQITGGYAHSIFLDTNGNVYSCGSGGGGQLGHDDSSSKYTPTLIQYFATNNITISQTSAGAEHSIFLDTDGNVYSCGGNFRGFLGHGNTSRLYTPTLIQYFYTNNIIISQVYASIYHSLFFSNEPYYQTIEYPAQWTYSDTDASVYHLGNVGIGTEADTSKSLTITGDINVDGNIFIDDAKMSLPKYKYSLYDNEPTISDNIRSLPVYNNRTNSIQKAAEDISGVKGWRLVRFLPGNATAWHPINDNLVGTTTYGTAYDYTNAFSVEFGDFDEFMFSNANMRNWLHATREQAIGVTYDNTQRTIIKSSISNNSYEARWYNRSAGHDPLITVEDWSVSSTGDKHGILYMEDTYDGNEEYFSNSGGMCVFVRNSTDSVSSVATDYTHKYMMFTYNNYYESTFSYYTVHNINFPIDTQCDVLVVGGGGSGGPDQGGGGGAGGLVYLQNVTLKGDYSLVVGKGGAQTPYASNANNGYSSYFNKSRLTTYEDDNFEDYANGTIYGELSGIQNNTYNITLSNGIKTRLTGWTHTRNYASGFLRNINGDAYLTAFDLIPGRSYDFATYSNNTNSGEHRDSYFNVNGGSTITVKQRQTKQPTYVGHAVADSNGEIIFKFWRSASHIQFSGISISLNEGRYTGIYGGGGGRYSTSTSTYHGLDGGSGGGGANGHTSGITATGGDSIQEEYLDSEGNKRGWGNPGGQGLLNSYSGNYVSAGGGGAGASGEDVISNATAGNGGDGKEIGITGIMNYYSGGGGGGNGSNSGAYGGEGGLGGGGHGGTTSSLYVASSTINKYKDGLPHTGSGGGGVRNGATNSGAGGSGVIIIRYALGTARNYLSNWTYSSSYDEVSLMGYVGIGKTPTTELDIDGIFIANAKNFKIEHPIVNNMHLYHACIEGPRFDNIYRGKKVIVNGYCEVDIDTECNNTGGMIPGTFVALNTDYQLYLQNNQTFDKVKGYIEDGKIKINSLNTTDNILVDWLVIGERQDKGIIKSSLTNAKGKLICEH